MSIIKKVAYGRILFENKFYSYHATKGYRIRNVKQQQLTTGYNNIIEFLSKGK